MKKIFAFLVCAALICATPIVAFAEEITEATVTEEQTTEVVTEAVTEVVTEPVTEAPTDEVVLTTDMIVSWIREHFEEISVVVTLLFTAFFQAVKHASLNKSVALCNNNAVTIAEHSSDAINEALAKVEGVASVVAEYKEQIASLLSEIRQSDEEKKRLEVAFAELENYLKKSKLANLELSNEIAELLVLANIPNTKKEELYSRHRAAVDEIATVDIKTEVTTNVGEDS